MKKFLYAAVISLFAVSASAQEDPNVIPTFVDLNCFKSVKVYTDMLETKYGEKPLFAGKSILPVADFAKGEPNFIEGVLLVYVNQDAGTFTSVMVFPDGTGCEVSYGGEFTPVTN